MWSKKKPDTTQATGPEPTNLQMNQPPNPASASWEGTTKTDKDVMRPAGGTAELAPSRLGSSLHLKGEISGNEDLDIDGTVEGPGCVAGLGLLDDSHFSRSAYTQQDLHLLKADTVHALEVTDGLHHCRALSRDERHFLCRCVPGGLYPSGKGPHL